MPTPQRTTSRRRVLLACLALTLAALATPRVEADPTDQTAQRLASQRIRYEQAMDRRRAEVEDAIRDAIAKALRRGDDHEAQRRRDALANFMSRGKMPGLTSDQKWTSRYAQTADDMADAYARAIAEYTRQDETLLADALLAESTAFAQHWDLVPWTDAPLSQHKTLAPGSPISFIADVDADYRLEIVARRRTDNAELRIRFPLDETRAAETTALPDADGNLRIIVTVIDAHPHADLGLTRPLTTTNAESRTPREVSLEAAGGRIEIISARIKPVIKGSPPDTGKPAKQPPRRADDDSKPNDPKNLLPLKSQWSGELYGDTAGRRTADVTVIRHHNDTVVLAVTDKHGTYEWYLELSGRSFVVTAVLPKRKNLAAITLKSGRGTVRDDIIRWDGKWIWRTNSKSGAADVYLEVKRK